MTAAPPRARRAGGSTACCCSTSRRASRRTRRCSARKRAVRAPRRPATPARSTRCASGLLPLVLRRGDQVRAVAARRAQGVRRDARASARRRRPATPKARSCATAPRRVHAPPTSTPRCARFAGRIAQMPPRYAALKFEGRAYYEYARAGHRDSARAARGRDRRARARRLGAAATPCCASTAARAPTSACSPRTSRGALGSCAHLAALRRTATGRFALADAVTLDALEAMDAAGARRAAAAGRRAAGRAARDRPRRAGGVGAAARAGGRACRRRGRRASLLRSGRRVPRRRDGGGRDPAGRADAALRRRAQTRRA